MSERPDRTRKRWGTTGCSRALMLAAVLFAASIFPAASALAQTDAARPGGAGKSSKATPSAKSATANAFANVKSWGYQLRGIEPDVVARSPYDAVVIDFADREKPFTPAEVQAMRIKPDGSRRIVLAYLSIGEAERYRSYWQPAWEQQPPAWLGPENPEWRGNYPVRFWDHAWQKVIFGETNAYLDQIMAAGFDGAYLDRVDVHSLWEKEQTGTDRRMMDFVAGLSAYAKHRRPEFLIVPQNAEELLEDDLYLRSIDAVAKEDLLYGLGHGDKPNPTADVTHSANLLKRARRAGKGVLVVEYLCRREDVLKTERQIAQEFGFLPYIGPRTLHHLGMSEEDYCLPPGAMGRRVALLFGSSDYKFAPKVPAPAAGVKALAAALRQSGFTEVRERVDLGRDSMSQELQRFAEIARGAEWAVVYYGGLGFSLGGANYLLPVNARIDRPADVDREAVALDEVEIAVEPANKVRLVFLDACRPNPFLEQMQKRGMSQPAGPGITARLSPRAITIGYASRCESAIQPTVGAAATDLDVYTSALARHLVTPGLELPWFMERVRDSVLRATKGAQEPVHLGTLPDSVMFMPAPAETQTR
jgi:cysteinyl-tRNA synthetase, unknown class